MSNEDELAFFVGLVDGRGEVWVAKCQSVHPNGFGRVYELIETELIDFYLSFSLSFYFV